MRLMAAAAFVVLAGCAADPVPGGSSGVEGTALVGPTCPVERDPPEPGCEDRPYDGALDVVRSPTGVAVRTFHTQPDGSFRVALAPGTYEIRSPAGTSAPPTCGSSSFDVVEGQFATVEVACDSGIR